MRFSSCEFALGGQRKETPSALETRSNQQRRNSIFHAALRLGDMVSRVADLTANQ